MFINAKSKDSSTEAIKGGDSCEAESSLMLNKASDAADKPVFLKVAGPNSPLTVETDKDLTKQEANYILCIIPKVVF